MIEIDKTLLKWILSLDDEEIYAKNYGSFSITRMDFSLNISDEEIKKFDKAEKLIIENDGVAPSDEIEQNYYRFIQAHNHELFHYYQALSLPAFSIYQKLSKTKFELEAAIMLRYFEDGYSYIIGKDKKVLDVLEQSNFKLPTNEIKNFNEVVKKYKFFHAQWRKEYKEVSLFHIIEGMAHIMSIQLTPSSKNHLPKMEDNPDYYIAYNIFNSYIDTQYMNIDIRIRHLTFLYVCFFSCQIYSLPESETLEKTSRLFHVLCSRLNLYFNAFTKLLARYVNYSEDELRQLNQFNIEEKDIKEATKNQLANIFAFYELISFFEQDAEKFYDIKNDSSLDREDELLEILKSLNIDLLNIYQLANFALFPSKMADMWEAYDLIQKSKVAENKFNNADEIAFFELIQNCKKLLNVRPSLIPCCPEHGSIKDKREILECVNESGLSYYLKELTQREAIDLFKIPEVKYNVAE